MEVIINKNNDVLNIKLIGRLDTITTPEVENKIMNQLDGITKIIFDCKELEYISAAGLRF